MNLYMGFIETLVMVYIVSEILAHIDHKGQNWTWNMTSTIYDAIHLGSTSLPLNNIDHYG